MNHKRTVYYRNTGNPVVFDALPFVLIGKHYIVYNLNFSDNQVLLKEGEIKIKSTKQEMPKRQYSVTAQQCATFEFSLFFHIMLVVSVQQCPI